MPIDCVIAAARPAPALETLDKLLAIAENKASCRLAGDKHARVWKLLAKVLIDKTARHFDIDAHILDDDLENVGTRQNDIEPNNEL